MIIANGYIEFKRKVAGGGISPTTGHPIKVDAYSYGAPLACQYIANKQDNLGVIQGEHFRVAIYEILIEERTIDSELLRLSDANGNVIGEYSILSVEPLQAVCEVRILVSQSIRNANNR